MSEVSGVSSFEAYSLDATPFTKTNKIEKQICLQNYFFKQYDKNHIYTHIVYTLRCI